MSLSKLRQGLEMLNLFTFLFMQPGLWISSLIWCFRYCVSCAIHSIVVSNHLCWEEKLSATSTLQAQGMQSFSFIVVHWILDCLLHYYTSFYCNILLLFELPASVKTSQHFCAQAFDLYCAWIYDVRYYICNLCRTIN